MPAPRTCFESVGLTAKRFFKEFGVKGLSAAGSECEFHVASAFGDEIDTESSVIEWQDKIFTVFASLHPRRHAVARRQGDADFRGAPSRRSSTRIKSVPIFPAEVKRRFRRLRR